MPAVDHQVNLFPEVKNIDYEDRAREEFAAGRSVTLYHGTHCGNAERLLARGKIGLATVGANQGQPHLLYVTTHPENAQWFAEQAGGSDILEITVPAAQLRVDMEDGVHETVGAELEAAARFGIPASLALSGALPSEHFRRWGTPLAVERTPLQQFLDKRFGEATAPDDSMQKDNFMAWFGLSQCTDDDGLPKVMYHGTSVWDLGERKLGDIDAFDRLASVTQVRRKPSLDTVGSWFSSNPSEKGAAMYSGSNGAIYPVFLQILDPWSTTFEGMTRRARALGGQQDGEMVNQVSVDALRYWLKETGRDGIRIHHNPGSDSTEFEHQTGWIALEPHQAKSALGNCGAFNPSDPSMSDALARAAGLELEIAQSRRQRALAVIKDDVSLLRIHP